jgi:hypothetical protein
MNLETEYMTAYVDSRTPIDPHMTTSKLSGGTGEPIPNHGTASMNQTVPRDERLDCVDFPTDEVVLSSTMTAVIPCIDATRRDLEISSMGMLLSGDNSGYITAQSTLNQPHSSKFKHST